MTLDENGNTPALQKKDIKCLKTRFSLLIDFQSQNGCTTEIAMTSVVLSVPA